MLTTRSLIAAVPPSFIFYMLMSISLTGCTAVATVDPDTSPLTSGSSSEERNSVTVCPVTEPVWAKPPDDPAVDGSPEFGYYFVNQDRSIYASAWWTGEEEDHLRVSEEGIKVGWFRPTGAVLEITGHRLDGQSPPVEAHVPCCYPTRFQATGLIFPTEGCWEVNAQAAGSALSFVVIVKP